MNNANANPQIVFNFLLPINNNDGKPFDAVLLDGIEKGIRSKFKGLTLVTTGAKGWYEDPESAKEVEDISRLYQVSIDWDDVPTLIRMLGKARRELDQTSIYITVENRAYFLEKEKKDVIKLILGKYDSTGTSTWTYTVEELDFDGGSEETLGAMTIKKKLVKKSQTFYGVR